MNEIRNLKVLLVDDMDTVIKAFKNKLSELRIDNKFQLN